MIKEIAFHLPLNVYHVHSKITTGLISIKTIPNLLATHNIAIIKSEISFGVTRIEFACMSSSRAN